LKKTKIPARRNCQASAVRSVAGRPAKTTNGFAPADTSGTLSTREASAQHVYISGLRLSASHAVDGRPFGLVCEVKNSNSREWVLQRADAFPVAGVGGLRGLLEPKITVVPRVFSLGLCPTPHKGSDRRRPFLGL
jgi:hypothetical protein